MKEHKNTEEVAQNATQMQPKPQARKSPLPKTSVAYWKNRVKIPAGKPHFGVQISHAGERRFFALGTAEKTAAADKAKNLYLQIVAQGWKAVLQKHRPGTHKPERIATVGELIAAVQQTVTYRPLTFAAYAGCLRTIAADIAGIGDQPETDENGNPCKDRRGRVKYLSRRHGKGNQLWKAAVDSVSLSVLSADAVAAWLKAYSERAGDSPKARKKAEGSASSVIRNARSMFTEKALEHVKLKLPETLPFSGKLKLKRSASTFTAKLNILEVISSAQAELAAEPLKIFMLGLLSGLRKGEIDKLEWEAVDLRQGKIILVQTDYFSPKTDEDEEQSIDLDAELVAMLAGWQTITKGPFVVESDAEPKPHSARAHYRAEQHFKVLYAWLRSKGVKAQKPLHELRKELGSHLANHQGIYAAQQVLRHAQISTTAAYYADKTRKITGGLGALLNVPPPPQNVVEAEFRTEIKSPPTAKRKAQK